jgi:hypothetical protein
MLFKISAVRYDNRDSMANIFLWPKVQEAKSSGKKSLGTKIQWWTVQGQQVQGQKFKERKVQEGQRHGTVAII